ncbi:MAG: hypothetical protein AAF903_03670 [Pseudomonadota bacterium]
MSDNADQNHSETEHIHPLGRALLWIEQPDNIGRMIGFLAVLCFFLVVGDFVFNRYGYFDFEETYGFYPVLAVCAFFIVTFAVRVLRYFVQLPANYYGSNSVEGEAFPEQDLGVKEFGRD